MRDSKNVKDLLFYELAANKTSTIEKNLTNSFFTMAPGLLSLALVFAFFINMDFTGVVKRTVQGFCAVVLFGTLLAGARDLGFMLGDEIISSDNFIWKEWDKATSLTASGFVKDSSLKSAQKEDKESGIGNWFSGIASDGISFFIWIVSNLALIFTKISFTLVYYLILLTIPIVAAVNIFPMSSKALEGSMLSIMWVGVSPVVFSIMLEILDGIVADHVPIGTFSFVAKASTGLIFSLYLIGSLGISLKVVSAGTIGEAINSVSSQMGTGIVLGAASSARNLVKAKTNSAGRYLAFGGKNSDSPLKRMNAGLSSARDSLSDNARALVDSKESTARDLVTGKKPDLTAKERLSIAAGTAARPLEALRMSKQKRLVANDLLKSGNGNEVIKSEKVRNTLGEEPRKRKMVKNKKVVNFSPKPNNLAGSYEDQLQQPLVGSKNSNVGSSTFGSEGLATNPDSSTGKNDPATSKKLKTYTHHNQDWWDKQSDPYKKSMRNKYGIVGEPTAGETYKARSTDA